MEFDDQKILRKVFHKIPMNGKMKKYVNKLHFNGSEREIQEGMCQRSTLHSVLIANQRKDSCTASLYSRP